LTTHLYYTPLMYFTTHLSVPSIYTNIYPTLHMYSSNLTPKQANQQLMYGPIYHHIMHMIYGHKFSKVTFLEAFYGKYTGH